MIFIIDDDRPMADCVAIACYHYDENIPVKIFGNAISAISALDETDSLPDLIFLDILLDGPDGFTLLHELASYTDTAKIPIIIISTLKLPQDLSVYGVKRVLDKSTMTPTDITSCLKEFC